MAHILVLGAGLAGLTTAMLLADDGHRVTVLERDPAQPPPVAHAAVAWDDWRRHGVSQFRLPHFMLPRWWSLIRTHLPDVAGPLLSAGALPVNLLGALPEARRGALRADDSRFDTVTARRPVLEAVLAGAAEAVGVTLRRGVAVTGLAIDRQPCAPHVTGVRTTGGGTAPADLVVDCGGRRSALGAWLSAAGAHPPIEQREDSGFRYYARHFRSRSGLLPAVLTSLLHHYDSLSVLTLPGDNDTWSVVLTTSGRDRALRPLRDPDRWYAALARYPLAAHWADGEPISGVDVMAGIEDRYRRLVVDGRPVATGVVPVGDACACTNPSLGRGASMALIQAVLLRDLLRETDPRDHHTFARRFDEATTQTIEPLYRATLWYDRHRLAELDADAAGRPYRPADPRWRAGAALFAASLADPELTRAHTALASFIATPDEVFAVPGVLDRALALGGDADRYPLPGPSRAELLGTLE
ncbi:FAD-dependent oxidoreductase [Micromonospora humi]|uniref:2-polyprenyl-6-methoxyphenol hydroxylase n=1 Tax=Micromonospora humi TaxID=745366 RepID=A0A1C5JC34_9ACTN|nr:FAD-dependent oxidoreductase [Micromonospora humi]SCG68137.1 2-polyprenyl-6-methoxyphenol hydroxylase [Micromonospora humi]